jgi:hypothetical protein
VKDFVFQIDSCAVSKRSVVCEPTVINTSAQDQEILMSVAGADYSDDLGKMTRIVDGFGVEYIPKDIHLGSASKKFGAGLGVCCPDSVARGAACSFGGCLITNTLVPRVPMKIRLLFANINPEAKTLALLRVYFVWKDPEGEKLSADLRDIPIIR